MSVRVQVTVKDTMGFFREELGSFIFDPNGYTPTNDYFARVPDAFIDAGGMTTEARAAFLRWLYGPDWEAGNGDGAKYFVLAFTTRVLGDADRERWTKEKNAVVFADDGTATKIEGAAL